MSGPAVRALVAGAVGLLLVAAAGTAHAYSVTPSCESPPFSGDFEPCSSWHNADVRLTWDWEPDTETEFSGCGTYTRTTDTPGVERSCQVWWGALNLPATTTIRVDETAPTVTAAIPERPPDYGGWYNRPASFSFSGADSLSGLQSCSPATFAGPGGAGVLVTGTCRDVAGNAGNASFPLSYDSTPPLLEGLTGAAGDATARISWHPSADTVLSEVVRAPGENGEPSRKVYGGTAATFTDIGLLNGVSYTYTVTAFDQAHNGASAAVTAKPEATRLAAGETRRVNSAPVIRWRRVKRARYYNLQVLRGRKKVLSVWPARARYQMRQTWRFRGRRQRLVRGRYRWYVWPGYGSRAARRYGELLAKGSFSYAPRGR